MPANTAMQKQDLPTPPAALPQFFRQAKYPPAVFARQGPAIPRANAVRPSEKSSFQAASAKQEHTAIEERPRSKKAKPSV